RVMRTITNTATVASGEPDAVISNNTDSQSTQVEFADLTVSHVPTFERVAPGGKITYLVTDGNAAGVAAGAVILTSTLPAGTSVISCGSPVGATCAGSGNTRTLMFPSLAAGSSTTAIVVVTVDPGVADGATLSSTATVSAVALPDPDPTNNSATASVAVTAAPIRLSGNGKIAFSSSAAPTLRIRLINPDSGGLTDLTSGLDLETRPVWSADGTKLASRSGNAIKVVNADGSDVRNITTGAAPSGADLAFDAGPTWAPSGNRLAYVGADNSVYVVGGDGLSKLIDNSALIGGLDWSPDGERFVFTRDGDLFVMDVTGGNQARLTAGAALDHSPDWSPDGSSILFTRSSSTDARSGDAYLINSDGTGEKRLLNVAGATSAAWSPDGSQLVFQLGTRLHRINVDGTALMRLTNEDDFYDPAPDWQPLPGVVPSPTPTPGPVHTISGRVTFGEIFNFGAALVLSGTRTGTIYPDANGDYTLVNLPAGGNYTVTPTSIFYTFAPASRTYDNLRANQTGADFSATLIRPTVSGRILDPQGNGIREVIVRLTRFGGHQGSEARTDAGGRYSFTNLLAGDGFSVFPYHDRYTFEPVSIDLPLLNGDHTANFVGAERQSIEFSTRDFTVLEGDGRARVDLVRRPLGPGERGVFHL
ncbi:MAG: hypothetical protein ACRD9R_19720, partial [Pyrinomonadaceae bacterium]